MKRSATGTSAPTREPPSFPALTKQQRAWIATRRKELKAAIDEGIKSGEDDGYRDFDAARILGFIAERRASKLTKRAKRA